MPKLYNISTNNYVILTSEAGSDDLQTAVNAAISAKKPLYIGAGTFLFDNLTINAPVKIFGSKGHTSLQSSSSNAPYITIEKGDGVSRISDVTLEGLQINGAGKGFTAPADRQALVRARMVDRLVIRECYFLDSQASGIHVTQCSTQIENNEFWACRTAITAYKCMGLVIEGNYIRDSKDNGIDVSRYDFAAQNWPTFEGAIIRNNKIYTVTNESGGSGQYGNAIICTQANGITVTGNIILNTNYSGIRLNACSQSHVSDNTIYNARETALFIESLGPDVDGYKGVTISNNVIDGSGNGISIANPTNGARRVTVTGNTVSNLTIRVFDEWKTADRNAATRYTMRTYAVGISMEGADLVAEGNIIENCAGLGMTLYSSGDWNPAENVKARRTNTSVAALIVNNIIKSCPIGLGYNMNDARGYAEVSGNVIAGSSNGAIVPIHKTDIVGADNPNSVDLVMAGPWVRDTGSSDIGTATTPIGNRYSFDRNKVVPLNS